MAGQRNGLLAHSLHQVTVRSKHVGVMIHQLATEYRREMALRERHSNRVSQSLSERTGGRFHAGGDEILRMPRRERTQLAESFDLVDRHLFVAKKMQHRIDQHGAVSGRKHEAIPVGPARVGHIKF